MKNFLGNRFKRKGKRINICDLILQTTSQNEVILNKLSIDWKYGQKTPCF